MTLNASGLTAPNYGDWKQHCAQYEQDCITAERLEEGDDRDQALLALTRRGQQLMKDLAEINALVQPSPKSAEYLLEQIRAHWLAGSITRKFQIAGREDPTREWASWELWFDQVRLPDFVPAPPRPLLEIPTAYDELRTLAERLQRVAELERDTPNDGAPDTFATICPPPTTCGKKSFDSIQRGLRRNRTEYHDSPNYDRNMLIWRRRYEAQDNAETWFDTLDEVAKVYPPVVKTTAINALKAICAFHQHPVPKSPPGRRKRS